MSKPPVLRFLPRRAAVSWVLLVAATGVSFAVGAEHGTGSAVAVVVLGIAAAKARLVGLDFMELRRAPIALRAAFEGYCVAIWAVLSGMYLWL